MIKLLKVDMAGVTIKEEITEENIDLYAEDDMNLAMQFPSCPNVRLSQNPVEDTETDDLFNDVVTDRVNNSNNCSFNNGSAENDSHLEESGGFGKDVPPVPKNKLNIYVGNLTWWTTDQQMEDTMKKIGVDDLIEIKFFENRSNGQSKGYCNVFVNSQLSIDLIREKLPKIEIHGKKPSVEIASKAALAQFESQAKTRPCPPSGPPLGCAPRTGTPGMPSYGMMPTGPRISGPPRPNRLGGPMTPTPHGLSPHRNMLGMPPPPPHHGPPVHHGGNFSHRPPMELHRPPYRPHHHHHHHQHPPMNMNYPNPNSGGMGYLGHPHHPRPEWMRPPVHHQYPYHPNPGPMQPSMGSPPMGMTNPPPGVHGPPPSPHVNPAFFQPHQFPGGPSPPGTTTNCEQVNNNERSPTSDLGTRSRNVEVFTSPKKERNSFSALSENEIEEIMSRNRSVSSSAISRAVTDAAGGDFASAIETLVTAISLIRQSRVSGEDRCKALVASLQDTLHGIESKGYRRARERTRSRSRSRERSGRHRRTRYYRSRSRGRTRSRERYCENRRSHSPSIRCMGTPDRGSRSDERDRYRRFEHENLHRELEKERSSKSTRMRDDEREHIELERERGESHRSRR